MCPLMMNLQHLLCSIQELVVSLHQRLAICQFLWVFNNFVKHRLIFHELLATRVVILTFHHVFNGLSAILEFILILLRFSRASSSLNFLVKRLDVGSLGPQKLRHISFEPLHLHLTLSFSDHLESIDV